MRRQLERAGRSPRRGADAFGGVGRRANGGRSAAADRGHGPGASHARAVARFERFVHQLEFAAAEAVALVELETRGEATLELQFDQQARERAIDDELARLKQPSAE